MNAQVFKMFGESNSMPFTQNIKQREKEEKHSKQDNYGKPLLILKSKQELLTCFIRMLVIENQINKTSELLSQAIFVPKLLSTHQKKKSLSAI